MVRGRNSAKKASANTSHITMPDLKQMVPFKADHGGRMGPVGMGVALSPVLSSFISSLPLPHMWDGPLVDPERLLQIIRDSPLNPPPAVAAAAAAAAGRSDGVKRPRTKAGGDESDGEDEDPDGRAGPGVKRGGSSDIYKHRMMKKIKSQQPGQ